MKERSGSSSSLPSRYSVRSCFTLDSPWRILVWGAATILSCPCALAQVGGGAVYNQDRTGGAQGNERAKRQVSKDEMPLTNSIYLDASVLINVKADEYVAVFGLAHEGATLEEARQKMDAAVGQFTSELKAAGVAASDMYVDFIAQNRIYGFEINGDLAKEKLTGFEVKKNVSIHYKSEPLLDKYIAAAAKNGVFDLIKVDYIVKDMGAVQTRLMEMATRVVKRKAANHARLLGINLKTPPQVYAEKYSSYYPTESYSSYVAQESEDVAAPFARQRFTVQGARKARTFYFEGLSGKLFDQVENPALTEPVVQFTLYLKLRYELSKPVPGRARNGRP
jgi:uncharacterized protein YggE